MSTRPVRVAHVTTIDLTLQVLLLGQLRRLRDEGFEVTAISAPGEPTVALEAEGIRHIPWRHATRAWRPLQDVRAFLELATILRRERFDIVHTHNPKPGIMGRVAARLVGTPCVCNTVHGLWAQPGDRLRRRAPVLAAERLAAACSDLELYQSEEDLAWARRIRLVPAAKTCLLGNGADLDAFRPASPERRRHLRQELGIDEEALVVGTVGRLVAEKGYRELFDAAAHVHRSHPAVVFLAIGMADPDKDDALTDSELRRARRHVVLTGWRENVTDLFAAMDVFVLASWREGLPRSVVEAAASGLPMVLTDIRGCREVGRHGVEALLVPPRNATALAEAILQLVGDPELRSALGRAARQRAEKRFDARRVEDLVVEEYRRLLTKSSRLGSTTTNLHEQTRDAPALGAGLPRRRRRVQRAVKRSADVAVSAACLAGLSPLMGAITVVVRRTMGAPVLFRQERLGKDGKLFTLYKFRTMRTTLSPDGTPLPDEDRLTAVGSFLRRTSLDELPELWNVLRGEMSLVGPRPLLPRYRDRYTPEQWRRHEVRPGLAGPVAARGRNSLSWDQKLALDVDYADRWSLWLDAKLLAASLWSTVRMHGIAADGHATMPEFLPDPTSENLLDHRPEQALDRGPERRTGGATAGDLA